MSTLGNIALSTLEKVILSIVLLTVTIALLPVSPFTLLIEWVDQQDLSFLKYFNYFLDIEKSLLVVTAWLGTISILYTLKVLLRLSNLIK